MARLPFLLAVSCLGTAAALVGGRALLRSAAEELTPQTSASSLQRTWRWSPDPERRREAALLLHARAGTASSLRGQRSYLRGQGWGPDPMAAVALKLDALDAQSLGREDLALYQWRDLWSRFPDLPASADALYVLGRKQPSLRQELLSRFPAHPAALAAALEQNAPGPARRAGALHLARWGARWPGARQRLRQVCGEAELGLSSAQRGQLADGLAQLRDGPSTLECLTPAAGSKGKGAGGSLGDAGVEVSGAAADLSLLSDAGRLNLGRTLLRGGPAQRRQGEQLLLGLIQNGAEQQPVPASLDAPMPEAEQAVRLLSQEQGPETLAILSQLPPPWRDTAPVRAHGVLALVESANGNDADVQRAGMEILRRWPQDPASWDLQWDLARRRLLAGQWRGALALLEAIDPRDLPPPLAARQRFWLGYSQRQLGQHEASTTTWRTLRLHNPGGYYGWRSALYLGEGDLSLEPGGQEASNAWHALASGDPDLDRLWRLDQRTEAWEWWRTGRKGQPPERNGELLVEGRLRQGVGDDWTGLGQLEQASLRLKPEQCDLLPQLEQSLHPWRFPAAFEPAAQSQDLPLALLLGVAKQESRFTPTVGSSAGAVGLMQLMPATAAELAGRPLSAAELKDPVRSAALGGQYLSNLLRLWEGDPILAVASYNAGPGAVEGWINPLLNSAPELWVEAIPYPETRLYVKKVLGNMWTYQQRPQPRC